MSDFPCLRLGRLHPLPKFSWHISQITVALQDLLLAWSQTPTKNSQTALLWFRFDVMTAELRTLSSCFIPTMIYNIVVDNKTYLSPIIIITPHRIKLLRLIHILSVLKSWIWVILLNPFTVLVLTKSSRTPGLVPSVWCRICRCDSFRVVILYMGSQLVYINFLFNTTFSENKPLTFLKRSVDGCFLVHLQRPSLWTWSSSRSSGLLIPSKPQSVISLHQAKRSTWKMKNKNFNTLLQCFGNVVWLYSMGGGIEILQSLSIQISIPEVSSYTWRYNAQRGL